MNRETAGQIAAMVNAHNNLARVLSVDEIVHDAGWVMIEEGGRVIGCSNVKRVQWYQAEIGRTCILPAWRGRGLAARLHELATERARQMGVGTVQCTTRADNAAGIAHARKSGYRRISSFVNPATSRSIIVWHKALDEKPVFRLVRSLRDWLRLL